MQFLSPPCSHQQGGSPVPLPVLPEEVSESVTLNWLSHYLVLNLLCWITNHFKYIPWLAFTWGETDQHWTAPQTIVIAMIFLWRIFRLKRKWFWQKKNRGRGWGAAMRFALTYIWLALAVVIAHWANLGIWGKECWLLILFVRRWPQSFKWVRGTSLITAEKETEWTRSEFPSWIFLIFHLYLSKSPCTGGGLPTPIPCEVLSAQDLVPPHPSVGWGRPFDLVTP